MPRISKAREEAVRGRILEAGITVFERRGFDRASIAAIADEAGMSAGSIYTYFESKEELFLAAFGTLIEEEEAALESAIRTSAITAEAIELAVDHFARLAAGGDGFRGAGASFLLHAWASADRNEPLRQTLIGRRAQASRLARTVIEGAISRHELAADLDVEGLAQGVVSMLDGLFLQRAEQGRDFTAEQAGRQARAVIGAIFAAAGPSTSGQEGRS
jgi:AcrR family transcriptional regulator